MATPLSASRLVKILRDEGLEVHEYRNWRSHNRNHKGAWGPINGVMVHHTVTRGTEGSVRLCYEGYSSLPGPLCHGVIAKDGSVHLVGNGRANHAGLGDDDVLRAVINESSSLPHDNEANTDGNARFYGFECINMGDGDDPWPDAQLEAIEKASAAICRAYGWNEHSVIGHREWQPGKVDPRGFSMNGMRDRIARRLGRKPDGPTDPPIPDKPKYEPYPGADFFHTGQHSKVVTAMGKRLVDEGCGRYEVGPGPNWTEVDRESYAAWQRKLGYSGKDADGIPGPTSWKKLRVPNV